MNMFLPLANAGDLAQWANRLEAPGYLPELVRRLIVATTNDLVQLKLRSGEGTRYSGYDGIIEVGKDHLFVPANLSVWEMGVDQDPKGKAEEDYKKRTEKPLDIDQSQTSFVFVTPRRWAGKDSWAADKHKDGIWHNVRVIDADDLEAWLGFAPSVHAWISDLVGKDSSGIQDLETFWTDWRQATQPPLSSELIICGRNDAMQRIIEHVQAQPSTLTVRADSQDEALAFIAAAFEQLPELARERVFTRASIVNSAQAWRQIVLTEQPILLFPRFWPVEVIQAIRRGHHVLIPAGREIADSNGMALLQRPSRLAAEAAFKNMGLSQERASSLAPIARRSLLTLRRQLSLNPEVQQPAWALPEKARSVLPAMLAGSWDEAIKGDQDAIAMLAGRSSYSEAVEDLVRYANESDPPVRQVGTIWFLVSKEDAWRLLARFLTKQDMEHFRQVTLDVLGILDPSLELPVDERWMANMMGRSRPHSSYLREGLADTLALISARAGDTLLGGIATGQNHANTIVTQLLQQANENPSGQVWTSLSDVLPLFAEAAPDSFLNAIDKALVGTDPVILKLFTDKSANSLTAKSAHPHLLWALERLAWSPDYLSRSALFLARLTRLNPSGHLANRPSSSLRGIFLPWCPQTTATFKQRLEVLDRLRKQEHEVSWKLLLSLLPIFHNLADLANAPRWRDWKPEEQEQSFSYPEWWNATEAFVTRLLDDIGTDSSQVSDLIDIIGDLPPSSRELVFTYLELLDPSAFDNSSRSTMWAKLREQVSRHRRYADAQWAMPKENIDRLATIYEHFKPEDLVQQVAWLFTSRPQLPEAEDNDFDKYSAAIYDAQAFAIQQVYQAEGLVGLFTLIEVVEQPGTLGWTLGHFCLAETEEDRLLNELGSSDTKRCQTAREYVRVRFLEHGWEWANRKLGENSLLRTPNQQADFFLHLSPKAETWDRLEQFDEETVDLYWTQFRSYVEDVADCLRAIEQLLVHGQAWHALHLLAFYLDKIMPKAEIIMNVLENAISIPISNSISQSVLYEVPQLFDYLNQVKDVDEGRLARAEWAFLPFFRYEERPLKILHGQLATDPAFFVDIISLAYRAADEEPRKLEKPELNRAETAFYLLRSLSIVPGMQDNGIIDIVKLSAWVDEARRLLAECRRLEIGDQYIGRVLRHAKKDEDELWPPKEIRDLLEELSSESIELGMEIAVRNDRGVTVRGIVMGGEQERQIKKHYLAQVEAVKLQWPRTAAMLRRLAYSYESDAQIYDREAELRQDTW
jgi:hypothetical protein